MGWGRGWISFFHLVALDFCGAAWNSNGRFGKCRFEESYAEFETSTSQLVYVAHAARVALCEACHFHALIAPRLLRPGVLPGETTSTFKLPGSDVRPGPWRSTDVGVLPAHNAEGRDRGGSRADRVCWWPWWIELHEMPERIRRLEVTVRRPISFFRPLDEEPEFTLADPEFALAEPGEEPGPEAGFRQREPVREPEYFVQLLAYLRERNRALASAAGVKTVEEMCDG
jgi:hypothetical protein